MFPAGANAFLRVGHARRLPRRLLLSEKNRHELVHAGIGEKQIRRVRQQAMTTAQWCAVSRERNRENSLTNLGAGHDAGIKRDI